MIAYLDTIGKEKTPAALEIGVSRTTFSNDSEVGGVVIQKFHKHFPSVSLHWLITGEGEMLVQNFEPTIQQQSSLEDRVTILEAAVASLLREKK